MASAPGHLFVLHGDLTKLACDGVVIPRDGWGNVSTWAHALFTDAPVPDGRYAQLPNGPSLRHGAHRHAFELIDTQARIDDVLRLSSAVAESVARVADGTTAGQGRARKLVALPLPGTGEGGLAHRRGAVVSALVGRLDEVAARGGFDVALVLRDERDHAAVQAHRTFRETDLEPSEVAHARRLGRLAAAGNLAVFAGAGLSVPLGLPDWQGLVERVCERAKVRTPGKSASQARLKERAAKAFGRLQADGFRDAVGEVLHTDRHALGHGLLAGLGLHQNVTTNFDCAYDIALRAVHDDLRVMTYQWAVTQSPWLLKLHGSVGENGWPLVFTDEQYAEHEQSGRPLYGLVQGLLMTSHLLFVGFSMTDSAYIKLAQEVERLYRDAEGKPDGGIATVLGLDPLQGQDGFEGMHDEGNVVFKEGGRDDAEAARALEIFLDRVSWEAARASGGAHQYFLDDRYADLVTDDDDTLRKSLEVSLAILRHGPRSELRDRIQAVLADLGA